MKYIAVIIAFMMFGCGTEINDTYSHRIAEWQEREKDCPAIESICPDSGDLYMDLILLRSQFQELQYQGDDPGNHWKTSCETMNDNGGDCEDLAAFHLRMLSDSCLPEKYGLDIRNRIYNKPGTNHVVVSVSGDQYFEIDNLTVIEESEIKSFPIIAEYQIRSHIQ